MRRLPIVAVAVLVAIVMVAAAMKIAKAPRRREAGVEPPLVSWRPGVLAVHSSLGAGAPPEVAAAPHGARMLHGDARHTHRGSGRAPVAMPRVAWERDVGGAVEAQVTTSPDEQTLYVASLGGALTAIARADGSVRWKIDLGDRVYSTPCVGDDGTLYVGSDAKKLRAVTPGGRTKWTLDTEDEQDTSPAIGKDGVVVFAAGRKVFGVRPSGVVAWRFSAKRKVFSSPAVASDGRVFFGSQDHRVYALDERGRVVWSVDLGADVDASPALGDDGAVFAGTDGDEVVRLEAGDGRIAWRTKVGGYVRGALSVARNGDVLAGTYGPAPRQLRLRGGDGSIAGEFAVQGTGAREFGVHGGAIEDDAGTLLFGAQDDAVYAVGAGGDLLWTFAAHGDVDAPLTLLSDGSVVVASDDGVVRLLQP